MKQEEQGRWQMFQALYCYGGWEKCSSTANPQHCPASDVQCLYGSAGFPPETGRTFHDGIPSQCYFWSVTRSTDRSAEAEFLKESSG